jgi:hypothetical protein
MFGASLGTWQLIEKTKAHTFSLQVTMKRS